MIEFEARFLESRGRPFQHNGKTYRMVYRYDTGNQESFHIAFQSGIEKPRQGIRLDSQEAMTVNGVAGQSFEIWRDTAPTSVQVNCQKHTEIAIRNIWDNGDGVAQSWHGGGAMVVEENIGELLFHCNSTMNNSDCRDLVFSLKGITKIS